MADQFTQVPDDARSTEPEYQQLARKLARRIRAREFAADGRLPYERDLARQYSLSRYTIRGALDILEAQGLIQRIRGKGTFVSPDHGGSRWFSTASTILLAQIQGNAAGIDAPNTYYGRIHAGVRKMARTLGLKVKQRNVYGYVRVLLSEYNLPAPEEVGGVILSGIFDQQYIKMYQSEGIPVVAIDYWAQDLTTDCVAIDTEAEATTLAELLASRGHTSLGFLASGRRQRDTNLWSLDPDIPRLLGHLRQATQRYGIQMRDEYVIFGSESLPHPAAAAHLLQLRSRPSAVLCFEPFLVQALLEAVRDRKLHCPEDISIIGRSGQNVAEHEVTYFASNCEMMGQQAVRLLAERMQGRRQQPVRVVLPATLVLGNTLGPAPRPISANSP